MRRAPKTEAVRKVLLADTERRLSHAEVGAQAQASQALVKRVIAELLAKGLIPLRGRKGRASSVPAIEAALQAGEEPTTIAARLDVHSSHVYQVRIKMEDRARVERLVRDG